MATDSTLLGAAGEHYVMAELLWRGYVAALAPQGVPNVDIVVTDREGARLCSIQVKTRRFGSNGGWMMNAKHQPITSERLFDRFVDFQKENEKPLVFIVPASVVASVLATSHRKWLSNPGKSGQTHKDTPVRQFLASSSHVFLEEQHSFGDGWLDCYREKWDVLGLEKAPVNFEAE